MAQLQSFHLKKITTNLMLLIFIFLCAFITNCSPVYIPVSTAYNTQTEGQKRQHVQKKHLLSFVGDIMAHRENYKMKDYRKIWIETAPVFLNDDFSFSNLEFVVDPTKPKSTYPRFNIDPPYVKAAIDAGMDVFSLANNHTADQGADSMQATLTVMENFRKQYNNSRPLYFSGIFRKRNEFLRPVYWTSKGVNFAFLAATQFSNKGEGLAYMNLVSYKHAKSIRHKLFSIIREAKANADIVIFSFHGGREYSLVPEQAKKDFFRQLLVCGADIVWAHHPHVLQPWRKYTINGSDKLIMYSMGNFISGQGHYIKPEKPRGKQYRGESGIIQVEVVSSEGKLAMDISAIPIVHYTHPDEGIIVKLFDSLDNYAIDPRWKSYYRERKKELYEMLQINSQLNSIQKK